MTIILARDSACSSSPLPNQHNISYQFSLRVPGELVEGLEADSGSGEWSSLHSMQIICKWHSLPLPSNLSPPLQNGDMKKKKDQKIIIKKHIQMQKI